MNVVSFQRREAYTDLSYHEEDGVVSWPLVVRCRETHEVVRRLGVIIMTQACDDTWTVCWDRRGSSVLLARGVDISVANIVATVAIDRFKRTGRAYLPGRSG